MRLEVIKKAVDPIAVSRFKDLDISGLAYHPGQVSGAGFLFVCMDEFLQYNKWQDWRSHLSNLSELGVAAVVVPEVVDSLALPQLVVENPRQALGRAARLLSGFLDEKLRLFAVTGTNGKTTTTRLLAHLLSQLGLPCGSIGTLGIKLESRLDYPGNYTTPLSPDIYADLRELSQCGARAVAMEVSSHGLALDRTEGLQFEGAILTNIERDHLDFHGSLEAYIAAKKSLFSKVKPTGWCVLNQSCVHTAAIANECTGQPVTYGTTASGADFELMDSAYLPTGTSFTILHHCNEWHFQTRLLGHFLVENCLAAIVLARSLGYKMEAIAEALASFQPVVGRMEQFPMPNGAVAIVDYAHNPDGLKNLLISARLLCRGTLHVVFGCGGDRDCGKRPIMGQIAASLADRCWVTSDNPRTEEPQRIIEDIVKGMEEISPPPHQEPDRATAIRKAYAATASGDLLVIAGKGHEDYQIIGYGKIPYSDQEVLKGLRMNNSSII